MEVKIRPLKTDDAYTSYKWRNDPEVFRYTGNRYDHEISLESELNWIKQVIYKKDDYRCAILADGEYVGNIYLTEIDEKKAHFHIFIGNKAYWGKGVARKASEILLEYAFLELGLQIITLNVDLRNVPAIRLYEKLGFKSETVNGRMLSMSCTSTVNG